MSISRQRPPIVRQTHTDSCWAAALESWSRIDLQIPNQQQETLVQRWGEGATGGITPQTKIPLIAEAFGLAWGGFPAEEFVRYLETRLPSSHVFCAYQRGEVLHAVVIYRLSDRGNVSYIDPDGGHDRWRPTDWFMLRGPFVLMRRL